MANRASYNQRLNRSKFGESGPRVTVRLGVRGVSMHLRIYFAERPAEGAAARRHIVVRVSGGAAAPAPVHFRTSQRAFRRAVPGLSRAKYRRFRRSVFSSIIGGESFRPRDGFIARWCRVKILPRDSRSIFGVQSPVDYARQLQRTARTKQDETGQVRTGCFGRPRICRMRRVRDSRTGLIDRVLLNLLRCTDLARKIVSVKLLRLLSCIFIYSYFSL